MRNKTYQQCTRCVMDTTDTDITFNSQGICNHCIEFEEITSKLWFPNTEGKHKLESLFNGIKQAGKDKEYDCILGLSGGLDSSYLALITKDYGLRPLVVHIDAGWNSELAIKNITTVVDHCNFKLHTKIIDWEEIKDLQLAFLKAGVANQDTVQDHAFFAGLYNFAVKNDVKYVISGGNIATEAIFPRSWHHAAMDVIQIKDIHKRFGEKSLHNFPTISFFQYFFYYPLIKKMNVIRPLNLIPYSKEIALARLLEIGYIPYDRKHGESRFTKWFQNYYLPTKFHMDKRLPHLSSTIVTGIINRDEALKKLEEPLYDEQDLVKDQAYIANKLGITNDELEALTNNPNHSYTDYKNWDMLYKSLKKLQALIAKVTGKRVNIYS